MATILAFFLAWPVIITVGIILSIAYIVATEKDFQGFAITATIIAGIIYAKPLWLFIAASWQLVLLAVLGYAIAGGANTVWRWLRFCKKYVETHPYKSVEDWEKGNTKSAESYYKSKLRPGDHKSQLISWIAYWPWSLLWNFIGDFLTAIYEALANVYQRTADSVIRKALNRAA